MTVRYRSAAAVVVVVAVLLLALATSCVAQFRQFEVNGTHYEVGLKIGQAFGADIRQFVNNYQGLQQLLKFVDTPRGAALLDAFTSCNSDAYPQYFDELQGLADGAQLPQRTLLVLNLESELGALAGLSYKNDVLGCSDVLIHKDGQTVLAHNEDADPSIKPLAVFVTAHIHDPRCSAEPYTYSAYQYPGFLAGNTFGFNSFGLVQTTNALFPKNPVPGGLARQFINRHMLASHNVDEAIARATVRPRAYGFSTNLAQLSDGTMLQAEIAPLEADVMQVEDNSTFHFNMYLRAPVAQVVDESSVHRLARALQLPLSSNAQDARRLLGDTADRDYPIYRNGYGPDAGVATLATAVFDLQAKQVQIYDANPALNAPVAVLSLS